MEIQVTNVGNPYQGGNGSKTWQQVDLEFIGKSGPSKKTIKDWEATYKQVVSLTPGDIVEVQVVKEGKWWNWKDVTKKAAGAQPTGAVSAAVAGAPKKAGDWETKEERANKQVYIVRQSSISNAIELLGAGSDVNAVLTTAEAFVKYVLDGTIPEPVKLVKAVKKEVAKEEIQ